MSNRLVGILILSTTLAWSACSDRKEEGASGPTSPTAVTSSGATASAGAMAAPSRDGSPSSPAAPAAHGGVPLPPEMSAEPSAINFPPRNEPYDFRLQLESKYRDGLRRNPVASFVDIEGTIVWTQEYLRYRLNGCSHLEAITRVGVQIGGLGVAPICGPETPAFPPRNEPYDFRLQLEQTYRDVLRRSTTQTYVDPEGDIVWTQEYLRYRVSGCGHVDSVSRVFAQIDGRGVQPDCLTGGGGGGSGVFDGVLGPRETGYRDFVMPVGGRLNVTLTWNDASVDLDLVVTTTSCTVLSISCNILAASVGLTNREFVSISNVRGGEVYRVWVENLSNRSQTFRLEAAVTAGSTSPTAATAGGAFEIVDTAGESTVGVIKRAGR